MSTQAAALIFGLSLLGVVTFFGWHVISKGTVGMTSEGSATGLGSFKISLTPAAVQAVAEKAIQGLPDVAKLDVPLRGSPTFQPHPLSMDVKDPLLRFLAIRVELEARLRRLGVSIGVDRDLNLDDLVKRLAEHDVFGAETADALIELLGMGDSVAHGARVDVSSLRSLSSAEATHRLLYSLAHLTTTLEQTAEQKRITEGAPTATEESSLDRILSGAALDEKGKPLLMPTETTSGQSVLVPVSKSGGAALTFWAPPTDEGWATGAFRDEAGNVLMTAIQVPGQGWLPVPVDDRLRPVIRLVGIVGQQGEMLFDPAQGLLPAEERTDAARVEEPAVPPRGPDWAAAALKAAARDKFGQLIMKKMRTADGGWADVVVDSKGDPLYTWVEAGRYGLTEEHGLREGKMRVVVMSGLGGLVAVAVDDAGRPLHSPEKVERLAKPELSVPK